MISEIQKMIQSDGGIVSIVTSLVIVAFMTGYNWYEVQNMFAKIPKIQKKTNVNQKKIMRNKRIIKNKEKQIEKLNRSFRIYACNDPDLGERAKDRLNCQEFN